MAYFGKRGNGEYKEFSAFGFVDAVLNKSYNEHLEKYDTIAADPDGKRILAVIRDDRWIFPDRDARITFYTANSVIQQPGDGWYYIYIAYPIKDDFKAAISRRYWVGSNGFKPNWKFPKSSLKEVKEFIRRKVL